ncbi:FAD:protein FMN transferase [Micromonospora sonneratiae]|uniref:FAD:protein FMN transferase n=1 Tax=Micromonospora sonneratiae TaxID=1184706 RepID=A0ABW3YMR3_9ACTN
MRTARWAYRGTAVRVTVTDPADLTGARRLVTTELSAMTRVCSPGRTDTELSQVHRAAGRPVRISSRLTGLLRAALGCAALTDGDVDPTVGMAILRLRLQRPWLPRYGSSIETGRADGDWRSVVLRTGWLTVPASVVLDLGAVTRAYTAQRCADLLAARYGNGALVGLGRCVATAGLLPAEGWPVSLDGERIMLAGAAVATSSGLDRDPPGSGIIDPRTGRPPEPLWASVSVVATGCAAAKALSAAAVLRGYDAVPWLESLGVAARLVTVDGTRKSVGAWAEWPGTWPAWHPGPTLPPARPRHS